MKTKFVMAALFLFLAQQIVTTPCFAAQAEVRLDTYRSFIFNDIAVLNNSFSPAYKLSLSSLLSELTTARPKPDPEKIIEEWLSKYGQGGTLPGAIPLANYVNLVSSWPKQPNGRLNLNQRNFVLNAVINRLDGVDDFTTNYEPQLRLEFQLMNVPQVGRPNERPFYQALYIVEIPLAKSVAKDEVLRDFAQRWATLSDTRLSQAEVERKLIDLVHAWISAWKKDPSSKVNINSMDFLDQFNIDFGAFCFDPVGRIEPCVSKMMLQTKFQDSGNPSLSTWFKQNIGSYIGGIANALPLDMQGSQGRFTRNLERLLPEDIKNPDTEIRLARAGFVANTCIGCHNATERNNDENLMLFERVQPTQYAHPTKFVLNSEMPKRVRVMEKLLSSKVRLNVQYESEKMFECAKFKSELSDQYKTGTINVPENYANPSGRQISLFYYTRMKPTQKPVAFVRDESDATSSRSPVALEAIEDRYDLGFVYLDQRGTGCSSQVPATISLQSAKRASLYSSVNVVRDLEVLRRHLFGKKSMWPVFGHGSGGGVVERYIAMYPHSLESASSYGGISEGSFSKKLASAMLSQVRVQATFFGFFPDSKPALLKLKTLLTPDKCFDIDTGTKICGAAVLSLIQRTMLNDEKTWSRLNRILTTGYEKCPDDVCLLNPDLSLNNKFWSDFAANSFPNFSNNKALVGYFFGMPGLALSRIASLRQDLKFRDRRPSIDRECDAAERIVEKSGVDLKDKLPVSDCDFLRQVYSNKDSDDLLEQVAAENFLLAADIRNGLDRNPNFGYSIYLPDRDYLSSYPSTSLRRLNHRQSSVTRVADRGRLGFAEEAKIWQKISGRTGRALRAERLTVFIDGESIEIRDLGMVSNTKLFSDLKPGEERKKLIHLGLAKEKIDPLLAGAVRGQFALVDRGEVAFAIKLANAKEAGAAGVIIANNEMFPGNPFPVLAGPGSAKFDFPAAMVSTADGGKLREAVRSGKTVEVRFDYNP